MADLATEEDLAARIGPLSDAQKQRAPALLADASALVRGFTRRDFTLTEDDEIVLRPVGTTLRLPQRPVIEVTSVVAVGGGPLPDVPLTGWTFDDIDKIDVGGLGMVVLNLPEWWYDLDGAPNTYRVVYSHGYEHVPPEIVAVVCGMVTRTLTAPSMVEGMVSERIGQYNYQLQQGSGGQGAGVRLTGADKQALIDAGYRRTAGTIQMGMR